MSPDTKITNKSQLPQPSGPRVLIVDDESAVCMVAKLMLEGAGYAITTAATATDALASIQSADWPFAVVLLDLSLPDRRGTDVIPELRILSPRSRVVLMSGYP